MTIFSSGFLLTGPFVSNSPCILWFYHLPPPRVPTQCCRAAIIVFCVIVYKNTCRKKRKTGRQSKLPFAVQPNSGGTVWEQFSAPDTVDFFFSRSHICLLNSTRTSLHGFQTLQKVWVCLMRCRAISASLQIATSLSLGPSVELWLCITRPQCSLISCSKEAKDRDKDLQDSWDRRQDHLNDTQISDPYINHTN